MNIRNDDAIRIFSRIFRSLDEERNKRRSETKHDGEEYNLLRDVNKRLANSVIEAGSYYLGPIVKKYIRTPVTQCLARKKGTDDYYLMKILILNDENLKDKFHLHRRTVFHTEYTILSLLKGHPGVIQLHDLFKDCVPYEGQGEGSGGPTELKRICMVLECLIQHGCHNSELTTMTEYLTEKKRLTESEALHIFLNILRVVEDLHNRNIVHKDLKLSNIVINRRTLQVKLINFYYAKLLTSETEVWCTQRGTPSYSPPDAVSGKPVSPKPCDMWSTGVILYTMLHGYLPFIGNPNWGSALANTRSLADLYSKIITNHYVISDDICLSDGTKKLIRSLLSKEPHARLKASEAVEMVSILIGLQSSQNTNLVECSQYSDQIVPDCPKFEERESSSCTECWLIVNPNVPNVTSKTYKIAISEVDTTKSSSKTTAAAVAATTTSTSTTTTTTTSTATTTATATATRHKTSKSTKSQEQQSPMLNSEKELLSRSGQGKASHPSRRNSMSRNSKIKFAMLRLGATSVNNIAALSFNYGDRNTSRSQM